MTLIDMRLSPIDMSYCMLEPICMNIPVPLLKMMFIPSMKSKSRVSCKIGVGGFVD